MKICVQIGHVNGQAGAAHEEDTLKVLLPHVVDRLRQAGHKVTVIDGSLQSAPPRNQYDYDGAVFLHCDSSTTSASGFSIGYWEELHPGSERLARTLRDVYARASQLRFIGYNITKDEHYYYGNRRFSRRTLCTLIEFGFVSNPTERAFLRTNAGRLGRAVADAYIQHFGGGAALKNKVEEEDDMPVRVISERPERFPAWCGGGERCYLDITDGSRDATGARVRLSLRGDDGGMAPPEAVKVFAVPPGATHRVEVGRDWSIGGSGGWTVQVDLIGGGPVDVWRKQTGG